MNNKMLEVRLAGGLSRMDNQQPQNVQRGPSQGPSEPPSGIGGF